MLLQYVCISYLYFVRAIRICLLKSRKFGLSDRPPRTGFHLAFHSPILIGFGKCSGAVLAGHLAVVIVPTSVIIVCRLPSTVRYTSISLPFRVLIAVSAVSKHYNTCAWSTDVATNEYIVCAFYRPHSACISCYSQRQFY